jgi:glycosyltransferase involved in cell wall biosynthesis
VTVALSVIMSVYNGEKFVEDAMSCILQQTFQDFEFIVVDNGSSDGTASLLGTYDDSRIRVVHLAANQSLTRALNIALSQAKGRYIARQDVDDISLPTRFAKQMEYLERHPEVALLGTWAEFISADGARMRLHRPPKMHGDIVRASVRYNPFVHSSVLFKRDLVMEMGCYPEDYVYAQDFALWLRLMRKYQVAILPEILVKVRLHSGQMGDLPLHRLLRAKEILALMEFASYQEGFVRGKKSPGLVEAMFDYSTALWNDGQYLRAFPFIAGSLLRYPHYWLIDRDLRRSLVLRILGRRCVAALKKRAHLSAEEREAV